MPTAPEGYFFRVTTGPFGIFPVVELRRPRRFLPGSVCVDSSWSSSEFSTTEEEIQFLADCILHRHERWKRTSADADRLTGDYPPLRLK
jgi:hypothetical protein